MKARLNIMITGASSDIGGSLARTFSGTSDIKLVCTSRHDSLLELGSSHRHLTGIDLTREEHIGLVARAAEEHFDGPFALIHCAGAFWRHKPLVHTHFGEIVEMINSHYVTLAATVWALLPVMVRRGGGRVVAFSCNSVGYSYPDMAPFTSSKAAVEAFVKCVANEYAAYNIAANAIALPTVLTDKVVVAKPHGDRENYITPVDIADVVLQLVRTAPVLFNGNVVKLFRYSPTFFNDAYFARNPRAIPISDGDKHCKMDGHCATPPLGA